tara:strand:- start:370 stop:1023 length:654 start_codon:yes stop_codon:yes gene_type:complete
MKADLLIPNKLSEISLKQYQKFLKVQENYDNDYLIQCKMIEIFCNLEPEMVLRLKVGEADKITKILNSIFKEETKLIRRFKLDGIEYGLIPDFDDMSLGEYIDLDTHIGNWDNILIAMNVLFRPIDKNVGEKYTIKEYDITSNEKLNEMPVDIVLGAVFFLYNLGLDLSKTMIIYLEEHQKDSSAHQQIFHENMDGIKLFSQDLHRGILDDLKISLN